MGTNAIQKASFTMNNDHDHDHDHADTKKDAIRLTIEIDGDVYKTLETLKKKMGLRSTGFLISQLLRELLVIDDAVDQGEEDRSRLNKEC